MSVPLYTCLVIFIIRLDWPLLILQLSKIFTSAFRRAGGVFCISQNSQENTCVGVKILVKKYVFYVLPHVFSCEFCKSFNIPFFLQNTSDGCFLTFKTFPSFTLKDTKEFLPYLIIKLFPARDNISFDGFDDDNDDEFYYGNTGGSHITRKGHRQEASPL